MIEWVVRRRTFVFVLSFALTVVGSLVYAGLPREASPDVKIPFVTVTTPYLGVSPADIESLVTNPLESELAGVKDLKQMSSTSYEGASVIFLEFEPEVDIQDALQLVRARVDRAKPKLPNEAEEPEIQEINFSDFPILLVTISGPTDEVTLKKLGEDLEEDLQRIPGVLDADVSGGRERELRVEVDPTRLSNYGLSLMDVLGSIRDENVNIPGGEVRTGDATFLLRVPGEFENAEQILDVAIKRVGDRPVFVRDVARVVDDFAPRTTLARMNGVTAISVSVSKRSGANIVDIADRVREVVAEHQATWPEGVTARALGDQSTVVRDMVSELENGILTGLILVVGVLLFFMGVRNSFFVALSIPLTMLLSFIVVALFGMTLNMIVLFSLIMALGMLVDNSIVLVDNIYRHVEEGKSLLDASILGAKEMAVPVFTSTLTTVVAFLPLVFWTGVMGQFMGYLPKTVIIVLTASIAVAIFLIPPFTSVMMKRSKVHKKEGEVGKIMERYVAVLRFAIRYRYLAVVVALVSFVLTIVAYGFLNHGTEFFAETEPNRAFVAVRAPLGTDIETTDRIVREIETVLAGEENIDVFVAEVGVSGGQDPVAGGQSGPNVARVTIDFLPDRNVAKAGERVRVEATSLTVERLRSAFAEIPGAEIRVEKENMGPPVGKPIDVRVSGEDFHELGRLAAGIRRDLAAQISGATDLTDDYRVGRPELRLEVDRGAAKRVGTSTQAIANVVRAAVNGMVATTLRDGEDEYDIVVKLAPEHSDELQSVLGLRIDGREDTSPSTFAVPISAVAHFHVAGGNGAIRHIDQKLVVSVTGDVAGGRNQNEVQAEVLKYIERQQAQMPAGYHLELGGSNDEQVETQKFLGNALGIGLILILLVLVGQFNSMAHSFIIMTSVLMSLIGVLWGLVLTGTPFGIMMTGLGVISLAGVVVNNAIVLLDCVDGLRAEGVDPHEAVVRAGVLRFRPVFLTAATTVLGLVPMAVGISYDFVAWKLIVGSSSAAWWGPMAVAIIFGLFVATVLTLLLVPSMYCIAVDMGNWTRRVFRRAPAA